MADLRNAVIVGSNRVPFGKVGGAYASATNIDLLTAALTDRAQRNRVAFRRGIGAGPAPRREDGPHVAGEVHRASARSRNGKQRNFDAGLALNTAIPLAARCGPIASIAGTNFFSRNSGRLSIG